MTKSMKYLCLLTVALVVAVFNGRAVAEPVPGGTLDPLTIPKYVIPLVIPPVMDNNGATDNYDIAVRQFQQQILPGGIWDTLADPGDLYPNFPATTLWSYGPASDPVPDSAELGGGVGIAPAGNSQFNYPAYTIETLSNTPVSVRWINDLINPDTGEFLPHILPLDQTLHWANPPAVGCRDGSTRTDCATDDPTFYTGPVPIVTHVHGAHVDGHSDGYPEAWWLPAAINIDPTFATSGTLFDDVTGANPGNLGYADYLYRQDQPATTLWYHDHSLGMTRLNVYAGPAGFWLIRGGEFDQVMKGSKKDNRHGTRPAVLPGPAPVAGQTVLDLNDPASATRQAIREIPIVIQDRSFNADGSLFYPDNRAHFEGIPPEDLQIDFVPDSDIAPIWNPEAFFNVMVVNGVAWPTLEVAPAIYRFRLLNGCNSRFLNLALEYEKVSDDDGDDDGDDRKKKPKIKELPFIQIGAEQGFLPQAVEIRQGYATFLSGKGKPKKKDRTPASDPQQGLLLSLAERADVLVDFRKLKHGTVVTMINTAPDAPFGGFPDDPADPDTSGQIMQFVVNKHLKTKQDKKTTNPYRLLPVAEGRLKEIPDVVRQVSLNEGESEEVCVFVDEYGDPLIPIVQDHTVIPPACGGDSAPFAPKEALLGTVDFSGVEPAGIGLKWTDTTGISTSADVTMQDGSVLSIDVTENPTVGDTETWEIYNFTEDAHPIHLHLVRFEVVDREVIGGEVRPPEPWETGFKDTVIAYPGEITRVKAEFDIPGLYVWHCHIVEHEDNEMMRPYVVSP